MRAVPALLVVLGVGGATLLGWRVLHGAGPVVAPAAPVASGGVPQGHVYTGCAGEPRDVNPFTTSDPAARRLVLRYTHDALLEIDPGSGELRGALADSFVPAADGASCTFTLRRDVRFADGAPVTLDDVLFGHELARAGHLPLGSFGDAMAQVERVEPVDARTFTVHFRDRHFAALRVVGEGWVVAQRRFFVERVAARCAPQPAPPVDSADFARLLDQIDGECGPGSGPYRLDNDPAGVSRWQPHQQLLLVRNEHCWRRATTAGTWNFAGIRMLVRDQAGIDNALLRGDLDWYTNPQLDELLRAQPRLTQQYRRLRYDHDQLGVYRMLWKCDRGPTADVRVRRALGMLFDVDALLAGADGGLTRALAHCKRGTAAYPEDVTPLPFDPGAARALLRDAGHDPAAGTPLRLLVLALDGTAMLARIADVFEDAANKAGIELELRRLGQPAFVEAKKNAAWHGLLGLQSFRSSGDPYDLLHTAGADNDGGFSHPDVDRLAARARTEIDAAARAATWREMHTIVYREQPAALLVHPLVSLLLARRIEGASIGPTGLVLERAFVSTAQQRS